ncbi:MAG: FAD-dependent oxidoreductase, partial [Pseudomonadota bacterium]
MPAHGPARSFPPCRTAAAAPADWPARREGGLWHAVLRDTDTGLERSVRARAIFNAAGPWVEKVLGSVAGVNAERRIRLVKGSHIILPRWWDGDHGYVLQAPDRRLIFVNPYFDDLALIGTTDIPFDGRAEDVAIDAGETAYLIDILNRYFDTALTPDHVRHAYSGVRPLFDDDSAKGASAVTRDYTFELDGGSGGDDERAPILSAFGGKLTTYRKLSEHALDRLAPYFPDLGPAWTEGAPLPGGDLPDADFDRWLTEFRADHPWLPGDLARHYARCYGTRAGTLLSGISTIEGLGRHFGALLYEAEIRSSPAPPPSTATPR